MNKHSWHLVEGYRPGILGTCVRMHADFYARHAGFGAFFEAQVAAGMADFVQRLDRPSNGIWSACAGDRMLGRSEEHTSELQSLLRTSYAVVCLQQNKTKRRQR